MRKGGGTRVIGKGRNKISFSVPHSQSSALSELTASPWDSLLYSSLLCNSLSNYHHLKLNLKPQYHNLRSLLSIMTTTVQDDQSDSGSKSPTRGTDKDKDKNAKSKAIAQNTKGTSLRSGSTCLDDSILFHFQTGKDLSHVPCKFFRVGQCTAGSSCVFSHHVAEPGEGKELCSWYVKGNCKFGHKCALAHIMPGQPMSMDRKNKKAAQQAAQSTNGTREKDGRKEDKSRSKERSGNPMPRLAVPTAIARPPMSISKATMSPSAPAPALRDADFVFGSLDGMLSENAEGSNSNIKDMAEASPSTATAWRKETITNSASSGGAAPALTAAGAKDDNLNKSPTYAERVAGETRKPSPLPLSTPSAPRGFTSPNGAPTIDFGPVGSPPRQSPMSAGLVHPSPTRYQQQNRMNGFSPGTSPTQTTETPFSAPITKTMFDPLNVDHSPSHMNDYTPKTTGLATSLGANMFLGSRAWNIQGLHSSAVDTEEDDIEDFLPSSLNELLTPAERHRRESRSNGVRPNLEAHHHRHSRSVPALALMDNMMNIWSDRPGDDHLSANANGPSSLNRPFGPSSFTGSGLEGMSGSSNVLGTSNVSAGFLSSLHPLRPGITTRSVSDSRALPPQPPLDYLNGSSKPSSFNNARFYEPSTFNGQQQQNQDGLVSGLSQMALSPTVRALHSHAPGTSLPQGLAGGYRIHARPTNNSIYGALSPPNSAGLEEGMQQFAAYNPGHPRMSDILASKPPASTRRPPLGLSSPLAGPMISHTDDLEEELFPMEMENGIEH